MGWPSLTWHYEQCKNVFSPPSQFSGFLSFIIWLPVIFPWFHLLVAKNKHSFWLYLRSHNFGIRRKHSSPPPRTSMCKCVSWGLMMKTNSSKFTQLGKQLNTSHHPQPGLFLHTLPAPCNPTLPAYSGQKGNIAKIKQDIQVNFSLTKILSCQLIGCW